MGNFPNWTLKTSGAVMPGERLPFAQTFIAGLQHVVAMFGATALALILMGFEPNVAILFSGVATLLFFVVTRGQLPSYLGSSFAFIGVVAVTRVYSTLVFVAAGIIALVLGFSPKFGAVIGTIPVAALGGLAIVVFGLIAATAGRIWVESKVDFSEPKHLLTVASVLILGAGDLKLPIFGFELGGIGTATFGAIALYHC